MENLLPEFRAPKTYHGFNIPLVKTQVSSSGRIEKDLGQKSKYSMRARTGNGRKKVRRRRPQSAVQFRRPFDAVRLQPSLGKEPRNRGVVREHEEAGKVGGWKFHTAGPSIYEYEYDGRRGRLEYDGYEEATEALRRIQPAIQR